MSALIVVSASPNAGGPGARPEVEARLVAALSRQGFSNPRVLEWPGGFATWFPTPGQPDALEALQFVGDGFIACVGTLFHRGRSGAEALRSMWEAFESPSKLVFEDPFGSYLVLLRKHGRTWLFGDRVGMMKVYRMPDQGVFCTSWLACAEACRTRTLDRVGVLDYVLSGASHGERTPLAEVQVCDPACAWDVSDASAHPLSTPADWQDGTVLTGFEDAAHECAGLIRDRARVVARGFTGRVNAALSGGFDSRLILAAMRSVDETPHLYVYGRAADDDVRLATRIARESGLAIRHVDKSALDAGLPELTPETLDAQMRFFDGLAIDGIFDRGSDRLTRIEQSADGGVALNGGGGEILRNFFYLRNGSFCAADLVRVFYPNYTADVFAHAADRAAYRRYVGASIARQIGTDARVPRPILDLSYPLYRNRFWAGRNNSIAARTGHFLTFLIDPALVRFSFRVPLEWKNNGRFESALICLLSRELGRFPMGYGFSPEQGAPLSYRVKMWFQDHRPPWLRERSATVKKALGRAREVRFDPKLRALWPAGAALDDIIVAERLCEPGQVARLHTLEYLAYRLGW